MFTTAVTTVMLMFGVSGVAGFANLPVASKASSTSLHMSREDNMKKIATSFVAAAFVMANTVALAPAMAFDDLDFGTTQVLAARSGGRVGGRSTMRSAPPPSHSTTHVIERTTYVAPPPVYSTGVVVAPAYYNPLPGLGK